MSSCWITRRRMKRSTSMTFSRGIRLVPGSSTPSTQLPIHFLTFRGRNTVRHLYLHRLRANPWPAPLFVYTAFISNQGCRRPRCVDKTHTLTPETDPVVHAAFRFADVPLSAGAIALLCGVRPFVETGGAYTLPDLQSMVLLALSSTCIRFISKIL